MTTNEMQGHLSPTPNRGGIFGVGLVQLLFIVLAGVFALLSGWVISWKFAATLFIVLFLLVIPYSGGIAGYQWLPRIYRIARMFLRGGFSRRSRAHLEGYEIFAPKMPKTLIDEFDKLEYQEFPYADGYVGVLNNRVDNTLTLSVEFIGGRFLLLDKNDQRAVVADFGDMLDGLAESDTPIRRLQWYHATLPPNTLDHNEYVKTNMTSSSAAKDQFGARAYAGAVDAAFQDGLRHIVGVVIQTDSKVGIMAKIKKEGHLRVFEDILVPSLLIVGQSLKDMGFHGLTVMDSGDYMRQMRRAFNPMASQDVDRDEIQLGEVQDGYDIPLIESPWPTLIEEHPGYVIIDDTYHSTFWIRAWGKRPVTVDYLARFLNAPDLIRRFSITASPMSGRTSSTLNRAASTLHDVKHLQNQKVGRRDSASDRQAREVNDQVDQELAHGYSEWKFSGYVTVSADSKEQLEKSIKLLKNTLRRDRIFVKKLNGWQLAGVGYTAPMARGLN